MSTTAAGLDMVWCLFPDRESAEAAATDLVTSGLAACANILGPANSIYRWQGQVTHAAEVPLLCKTAAGNGAALAERLAARHPYDLPAISWWHAECAPAVADWAAGS